jgi:uncharacterized protein YggE
MHWRTLALLAAAALGLSALACTPKTTVLPPDQEAPGITVSGEGSVFGEPDVAVISLGVEAEADSVGAARSQAADAMDKTLAALKDGGVDEKDIQTSRFSVQPQYDYSKDRQELIGFVVTNIVTAKIRNIDDTGDLIDAAVAAGGDLARIQDLQFTIDDPSALQDEARQEAMGDAQAKAQTLADAAGVHLGAPRSISESGGVLPDVYGAAALDLAEQATRTSVEPGQLEVTVQVQVVYGLE